MQEVLDREGKCGVDERFELPDLADVIANELPLLRALLARAHRGEAVIANTRKTMVVPLIR